MPQQNPALQVDAARQGNGNGHPSVGLQIRGERWSNAYVVSVSGELDLATAESFANALEKARRTDAPRIILDLEALRFIDSVGLSHLLRAELASRKESPGLFLTRGAHQVERMLELSGLQNQFRFLD
jgi:anti-anti-sigma factor